MNTVRFNIGIEDLEKAQEICNNIEDTEIRNNSIANTLAIIIAKKYFENIEDYHFEIDTDSSISLMQDLQYKHYDIADIYVNNNYVDVRLFFEGNDILIPASHYETGLLPAAYMFIKLESDLSGGEVVGFVLPESIESNLNDSSNIVINENNLVSFYKIEPFISPKESSNLPENYEILIHNFLSNRVENTKDFYELLLSNQEAREYLKLACKTSYIFKYISKAEMTLPESSQEVENTYEDLPFTEDDPTVDNNIIIEDYNSAEDNSFPEITEIPEQEFSEDFESKDEKNEEGIANAIDELYKHDTEENYNTGSLPANSKKTGILPIVALLSILLALGYFAYNNFGNTKPNTANKKTTTTKIIDKKVETIKTEAPKPTTEAMPNETLENTNVSPITEEANAVSIPAIEENLDVSISIDNLKVSWEVPYSYSSNAYAKRYLVKLGKIIQLNLKTELLLAEKQPITNRVSVELTFDKNKKSFDIKGITASSGETSIDNLILNIVKTALNNTSLFDTSSFNKLEGNPILVIRL